jgi:hypothetical protein
MLGGSMRKKPTKEEWVAFGMSQDHTALLEAIQKLDPQMLESYLAKDTENNPYLFNPVTKEN